jgi:hypothetical protein
MDINGTVVVRIKFNTVVSETQKKKQLCYGDGYSKGKKERQEGMRREEKRREGNGIVTIALGCD